MSKLAAIEIEKPVEDERARLFQEKINRQGREIAMARGQRDEALARIRVLENEVEELMRVDYWQDRHKIAIRERDMALEGVARMNAEFVHATKLVEALKIIEDPNSARKERDHSYSDWELRLIARNALAEYSKGRTGK